MYTITTEEDVATFYFVRFCDHSQRVLWAFRAKNYLIGGDLSMHKGIFDDGDSGDNGAFLITQVQRDLLHWKPMLEMFNKYIAEHPDAAKWFQIFNHRMYDPDTEYTDDSLNRAIVRLK